MAIINGWGRGTWNEGAWGTALPLTLTAPSAATSALGTVSVVAKANVSPSGLSITSTNGGVAVDAPGVVGVNGLAATGGLGTATTVSENSISVSGLAGTSALGTASTDAESNVTLSGLEATGSVGSTTQIAKANQTPTGQAGTSALGTATTQTDNRFVISSLNTYGSGRVGIPTFNCKCNVALTGVSATGELGKPFKWQEIDDNQTPNWSEVAA